jgi:outer membrane lipoprotein SlyB
LKGRAVLSVRLATVAVDGKEFAVSTNEVVRQSESHKKRNIGIIGGGSGLGAAIGAIAGGGKGALIGAAAGAGAGTAGAAATGKLQVSLPVETALSFSLKSPVTLN